MYKIILADGHPIVRIGIREILDSTLDLTVIEEVKTASELVERVKTNEYDAVLFDIFNNYMNGIDLLREIKKEKPTIPVLVFSIYPEEHYALRALRAGASGYVNKNVEPEKLIEALRKVISGGKFISQGTAERLAASMDNNGNGKGPMHERLTDREFQVMKMISSGMKLKEIAKLLSLSINTINSYRIIILEKLCLRSNVELTRYALKNKLID